MRDKIEKIIGLLVDAKVYCRTGDIKIPPYNAEDRDALDWAIDQLRWRRVEDELPEDGQVVLAVDCAGDARLARFDAHAEAFDDFYDDELTHVEWWRPITHPEGE